MFERRHEPLLPTSAFARRLAGSAMIAFVLVMPSLGVGVLGYHYIAKLAWIDAFVNAAMILSGMGPVNEIQGTSAKIFAGCYALYSGLVILSTAAILFSPVVHRILHRFHKSIEGENRKPPQ